MRHEPGQAVAPASAHGNSFAGHLSAVRRRIVALVVVEAVTLALVAAAFAIVAVRFLERYAPGGLVMRWPHVIIAGVAVLVVAAAWTRHRRLAFSLSSVATSIEQRAPQARNVVITAEQVLGSRLDATPRITDRLFAEATVIAAGVAPRAVVPAWRFALLGSISALSLAAATWLPAHTPTVRPYQASVTEAPGDADVAAVSIDLRVTPPAYTGRPPLDLRDPERVTVSEGSVLDVRPAEGSVSEVRLARESSHLRAWLNGRLLNGRARDGTTVVRVTPGESGSLVVEIGDERDRQRRAIALTVTPDPVPVVTIPTPGRDLLLDAARSRLDVGVMARDDLRLESLQLRYTSVSGSGEQFDFVEGVVPVAVSRTSAAEWTGTASIDLSSLNLEPGDLVAYRAVARDSRPSGGTGMSDTYVVRLAQPGDVASAGFAIDDDENRFALSQQMLLVKTERLHGERTRIAREAYDAQTRALAAEQRMIRNEFSFMVGGEVEDEEEEAAHSHELQEGRDDNQGRRDVLAAIRAMSRAEQMLNRADTTAALPHERVAVDALQRAFSRTRYLLRTLPVRAQIDLERRLSGDRAGARNSRRATPSTAEREHVAAMLSVITRLEAAGQRLASPPPADWRRELLDIADGVIALDPRSPSIAAAAQHLLDAGSSSGVEARHDGFNRAVSAILAELRARLAPAAHPGHSAHDAPLRAALARVVSNGTAPPGEHQR